MFKNTQLVALFTIISQLVSFLRMSIIATRFGVNSEIDVYNLAIVFPAIVVAIVVGWLQVSFVGSYLKIQKTEGKKEKKYLCSTLIMILLVSLIISGLSFLGSDDISTWLMPVSRIHHLQLLSKALKPIVWLIVPMVLCEYLSLILNCHNKFLASSMAPILNAIISALTLYLIPENSLNALILTLALGWVAQIIFMLITAQSFFRPTQFDIRYTCQQMRYSLGLAIPLIPAVVFSNATSAVMQGYLSRMGEGAVAIFGYASKFQAAITQIFVMGLSTVLLPHLANLFADKRNEEIGRLFVKLCKVTTFLYLILIVGVYLYGEGFLTILLGRGKFDHVVIGDVWWAWLLISTSVLPFAISTLLAKAFQALQKPWLLSLSSTISLLVTVVVCYFSLKKQSSTLLLLSFSVAQIAVLIFFSYFFQKFVCSIQFIRIFMQTALYSAVLLLMPLVGHFLLLGFFKSSLIIWPLDLFIFCSLLIIAVYYSKFIGWVNGK